MDLELHVMVVSHGSGCHLDRKHLFSTQKNSQVHLGILGLKAEVNTDYFLIGKEDRKQVANVKVVRGAEIGRGHYLVLLKVKLKMQRRQMTTERQWSQN